MEGVEFDEKPSSIRRRLSSQLSAGSFQRMSDASHDPALADRLNTLKDLAENLDLKENEETKSDLTMFKEEEDEDEDQKLKNGSDSLRSKGRVSVVPHRASALTRFLALPTVSDEFKSAQIRPTLINGFLYLKESNPDVTKFRALLKERLLEIPRFRSVLRRKEEASDVELLWDPLPRNDVDFEYHVHQIDGKGKFDDNDINSLVSNSFLQDFDISRPLWRFTLITNMKDGRSLLFCCIDHTIGDGVAMLAVMLGLLDDPPNGVEKPKSFQARRKQYPTLRWSHAIIAFLTGVKNGIIHSLAPPNDPYSTLKICEKEIKRECTGKTFLQTKKFDLMKMKEMKNRLEGATINDIVLAIYVIAIRKYFELTNDPALEVIRSIDKRASPYHLAFAFNARGTASRDQQVTNLGNSTTTFLLEMPLNYQNPVDAIWKCKCCVDELKRSPNFYIRKFITDLIMSTVPGSNLAPSMKHAMNKPTCTITNVMGPTFGASLAGYELDDLNFTTCANFGHYFGAVSYRNQMRFSIISDDRTKATIHDLKHCLEEAFEETMDALENSTEAELRRPDMTPMSAKILEWTFWTGLIFIPVALGMLLFRN